VQLANEIRNLRPTLRTSRTRPPAKRRRSSASPTRSRRSARSSRPQIEYDKLVAEAQTAIDAQATARQTASQQRQSAQGQVSQTNRTTADLERQLDQAEAQYEYLAAQPRRQRLGVFNGSKLAMWPLRGPITSGFGARWAASTTASKRHRRAEVHPDPRGVGRQGRTVGRPYLAYGDTASS